MDKIEKSHTTACVERLDVLQWSLNLAYIPKKQSRYIALNKITNLIKEYFQEWKCKLNSEGFVKAGSWKGVLG